MRPRTRNPFVSKAFAAALVGLSVMFAGCQRDDGPAAYKSSVEGKQMAIVNVPVEGMSCGACAARIKKTLKAIEGVHEVEVNLETRAARIRFEEGKVKTDHLTAAITDLGYKAGSPSEQ